MHDPRRNNRFGHCIAAIQIIYLKSPLYLSEQQHQQLSRNHSQEHCQRINC